MRIAIGGFQHETKGADRDRDWDRDRGQIGIGVRVGIRARRTIRVKANLIPKSIDLSANLSISVLALATSLLHGREAIVDTQS